MENSKKKSTEHDKRELKMDELEQVSGGGMIRVDNPYITNMKSENDITPDLFTSNARIH